MVTLEPEGVGGSLVDAATVGEQISVGVELGQDGSVGQDLPLYAVDLGGETEIDSLVEVIRLATLVLFEVVVGALASRTFAWVARLGDEAATFAPGQHLIDSSLQALGVRVAVNQLLTGKLNDLLLAALADAVCSCRES